MKFDSLKIIIELRMVGIKFMEKEQYIIFYCVHSILPRNLSLALFSIVDRHILDILSYKQYMLGWKYYHITSEEYNDGYFQKELVRAECVRCPWLLATINGIFFSFFLSSLQLIANSPRRGCRRVPKSCMGS